MNEEDILAKIGNRIKELRVNKEMTQDFLGAKYNWDYQYISRLESCTANMTIKTLIKLCTALEITLEEFFEEIN